MAKRKICQAMAVVLALGMCTTGLTGCGNEKRADGKTEIEVVSYKPEAVKAFEKIEKQFNETHDDIHLTISSPNEAMTILKTRFIREDYPDIIAIGGDINYSNFLDADLFEDISDLDAVDNVKEDVHKGRARNGTVPRSRQNYADSPDADRLSPAVRP